jgi:hypothetical protein
MTRRNSARLAGVAFLVYIASALTGFFLSSHASAGQGTAAQLSSIAAHAGEVRLAFVLQMVGCFCALILAVTLYAITRDEGRELALLGMVCRIAEGVIGAVSLPRMLERLWLATAAGADAPDPAAAGALAASLLKVPDPSSDLSAVFFSVGSLLFAWLLLRGRIVPVALAGLGVVASILTAVLLPLKLVDVAGSPVTDFMWLPMLVYEVGLAIWLIVRGAAAPAHARTS